MGNGELKVEFGEDIIEIPPECICKEDLIDEMYQKITDLEEIKHICLFAPKNTNVDEVNTKILHKVLPSQSVKYVSIDCVHTDDEEEKNNFPGKYLFLQKKDNFKLKIKK